MEETLSSFLDPERTLREAGVREGNIVIDFGAGSGAFTLPAAQIVGDKGRVFAVDVQQDMLTRIMHQAEAEGLQNVTTVWGDIDEPGGTTLSDRTGDIGILCNTLFQLEEKEDAMRELARVIKPGGLLLIIDWQESFSGMGPQPADVVRRTDALILADKAGFAFVKDVSAGSHHYGLVCKRAL